jgi:sugar (pentulose or hexulose) kinase
MDRILTVDVGTQSLRACIVDRDWVDLERQQIPYTPRVGSKNRVDIGGDVLWNAFVGACSRLKGAKEVEGISLSTLCPSLLAMDSQGNPLSPMILHLDRRSYRQALWALGRVGEDKFLQVAGNLPIPGGISLTSLLWIRDNAPSIYRRRDVVFGHAVTFFMKRLTDTFVIDPSNASFTGLYDTVGYGDWHDGLLGDLEIEREKLPRVVMSTTIVGGLDRRIAALTGLTSGIPVVVGANDTTCAAVGAGVTESGKLINSSGTVENMVLCLDRPLVSRDHLLRTHAYSGRWLAMRIVGAGGASLEWFRRTFCREMTKEVFYNDYLAEVLSTSRRPESRFQPFLSGDRHRIRQKTGSFTRLSLNTTREDCLLALTYGIVSFMAEGLREWRKKVHLNRQIYHVGGGARDAYTQYKQRWLKDFEFIQLGETALKGAAKLGFETLEGSSKVGCTD